MPGAGPQASSRHVPTFQETERAYVRAPAGTFSPAMARGQ
jgi:hypothetical protein